MVRVQDGFELGAADAEPEPDAVARGWASDDDGRRAEALFVLAGRAIGVGRGEQSGGTLWLDLDQLVNLDAIGDPDTSAGAAPLQEVEIIMEDGTRVGAGWPEAFCDAVVETLERLAGRGLEAPAADEAPRAATGPTGPDVRFDEIVAEPASEPTREVDAAAPSPQPVAPAPAPAAAPAPAPAPAAAANTARPGTLELEDVVYLGGYPGHTKKRKKCTATLTRAGLELAGPADLHFRISWDGVRTIEVQNSDEARFRMNAKIHRDASALVVECDQGVTILLEARDCPTIALRAAIGQLMADVPVVVV